MNDEVQKTVKVPAELGAFVDQLKVFYDVPIKTSVETSLEIMRELIRELPKEDRHDILAAIRAGDMAAVFAGLNI